MQLDPPQDLAYAVVIDAGSSGSRVHVFVYDPPSSPGKYASVRLPEPRLSIQPGLSAYAAETSGAGESLTPLLDFAKIQV